MRRRPVKIYEVAPRSKPDEKPKLRQDITLMGEGRTIDDQRASAVTKLEAAGFTVRSISFSPTDEIIAYVFTQTPNQRARAARSVKESSYPRR